MKHSYIQSSEYRKYNANTSGHNTTDCANRAISMAFGKDYNKVHKDLIYLMKDMGQDSYRYSFVYSTLINLYGGSKFKRDINPITKQKIENFHDMTLGEWIDSYASSGVYIVEVGPSGYKLNHLTCVIDGTIYDSWDCTDQYVHSYYVIENRRSLQLSGIENHFVELMYEAKELIIKNYEKLSTKYRIESGEFNIGESNISGFSFKIPMSFRYDTGKKELTFKWTVSYVFTPEASIDEARKKIRDITGIRLYDRFYEINKKIQEYHEGEELYEKSNNKNSNEIEDLWLTDQEQRFFNSLPGWVKPFVHHLYIKRPGQFRNSYQLDIDPIPGDSRPEVVKFRGSTSSQIKEQLQIYKSSFKRVDIDYDYYNYYE